MIKAVVFDMDDTLFLEKEYVLSGLSAVNEYLSKKGIPHFYEKAKILFESGHRGEIFNEVLDYLKVEYNNNDIMHLLEVYRNHKPSITMLDDAKWVVDQLKSNYYLGLITDGYLNVQQNKIHALNLEKDFDAIICSDQFGRDHWKPSEKPYIELKRKLQLEHRDLIYIGDNPTKDFIGAKGLGWRTIHISRAHSEYHGVAYPIINEADYKINNLYDLPLLLEQIELENQARSH